MTKKLISIVLPAYNEEECVDKLYAAFREVINAIPKYDFEVVIVENGSFDSTFEKLCEVNKKDPRFKILKLTRNCGADAGISAGLQFAKGDAVIITYADLEDPPHLIKEFLEKWEEGYKHVYGIVKARQGGFIRRMNSKIFYFLINKLTNDVVPKNVSDFRLIDRQVCREINSMTEQNKFLRGLFAWLNYKSIGIPYDRNMTRAGGESKAYTFSTIALAFRGIFSYSNFPLKIASFLGIATSSISFLGILFFLTDYVFFHNSPPFHGFGTIICVMLLLFGIMFLLIGLLGEYIGLIYNEVKGRPLFVVDQLVGIEEKKSV